MFMDYMAIINKYYPEDNDCKRILVKHSRMVADFALEIVERNPQLALDAQFVEEAAITKLEQSDGSDASDAKIGGLKYASLASLATLPE